MNAFAPTVGGDGVLQLPGRLLVVPAEEAAGYVHAQRAELARLTLQLRHLSEVATEEDADASEIIDLVREEALSTDRLAARRVELEEELVQVRQEAAELVATARQQAAAVREAARAELLADLRRQADELSPEPAPQSWSVPSVPPVPPVWPGVATPPGATPTFIYEAAVPNGTAPMAAVPTAGAPLGSVPVVPMAAHWAPPPVLQQPGSRLRSLTFVDVVLPLVAALIVLAILIAWVG